MCLGIISHTPSCLVQLATSQTQEHTEIQFYKMQDCILLIAFIFSLIHCRMQHFIELCRD